MDETDVAKNKSDATLPLPEEFPFPFPPYSIQQSFMKALFKVLDEGNIGIFESPTGTGKSLSLICGALTWLNEYNKHQVLQMESALQAHKLKEPDSETNGLHWFDSYTELKREELRINKIKQQYEKHQKDEEKYKLMKDRVRTKQNPLSDEDKDFNLLFKHKEEIRTAVKVELNAYKFESDLDEDLLLNEHSSDEEDLLSENAEKTEEEEDSLMRIIYCSRTHSQLSQFVHEVKKSPFGENVRMVVLGSRQSTCINNAVRKLKSLSLINDQCLNLQRNKKGKETKVANEGKIMKRKKSSQGCPFNKQSTVNTVKENVLVEVHDIEQLVAVGKKHLGCPYYSARLAAPEAQLVVIPYNTLLHKSTREASGVKIKGSVVIIDEAHNLLDAITSIHSAQINSSQIAQAHSQLLQYRDRYKHRFKPKNVLLINQLLFVLQAFMKQLEGKVGVNVEDQHVTKQETKLLLRSVFVFDAAIDNINLFNLLEFCKKTELSRKLRSFTEKYQPSIKIHSKEPNSKTSVSRFLQQLSSGLKKDANVIPETPEVEKQDFVASSPILQIEEFISALTNNADDTRVLISKNEPFSKSYMKVLILNPATHFKEVIDEARAIVVAGGTMQPVSEFRDQLFVNAGASLERISHFSCGHVIEADRLLPITLSRGPSGVELDFSYKNRQTTDMLDELGRTVCNICNVVPGGVVCFFPSYDYEKTVYDYWEKKGFLAQISKKKKVFREPRTSSMVDHVLNEYSNIISSSLNDKTTQLTGAVLLSVVGGKMSEGINFSDDLGRCVVMIGLPYPNINSPELKEKMDYLNASFQPINGRLPGQIHYDNLCMKAVNQSIGRAIRHRNDYAAILLLDRRYARPSIQSSLPQWIGKHLKTAEKFGVAFSLVCKFFNGKKS